MFTVVYVVVLLSEKMKYFPRVNNGEISNEVGHSKKRWGLGNAGYAVTW